MFLIFFNFLNLNFLKISCSKGFAIGSLRLLNALDDNEINFRFGMIALNESLVNFDFAESDATAILILEKDSVFQHLLDEKFMEMFPKTILVTVCNFRNFNFNKRMVLSLGQASNLHLFGSYYQAFLLNG